MEPVSKKRVFAYFDGSNFYHHLKENYGVKNINFYEISNQVLDPSVESLQQIKYYNSPINQQDDPAGYAKQLKFFGRLRSTPLVQVLLGNLRKRPLNKININCLNCGFQRAESIQCPVCKKLIDVRNCFRYSEKGVDVQLAIDLLLDAMNNKYDVAFLFSSDADFVPAIHHIVKKLKKDVMYCHFPKPRTDALRIACSESRQITQDMVDKAVIDTF
jgi:uncharacterized LabA/DUF88 family protein